MRSTCCCSSRAANMFREALSDSIIAGSIGLQQLLEPAYVYFPFAERCL